MTQTTSAGAKIYISTTANASATTEANFSGLTYSELGELISIPEFGASYEEIIGDTLNTRQRRRRKGVRDEGVITVEMWWDEEGDAGQAILAAAAETDDEYAFKVTYNNGTSTPTTRYFRALVMGYRENPAEVNAIIRATAPLAIQTAVVKVAAT